MKVFLSYEPLADEAFAQKLGKALTESGIQVTSVNLKIEYGDRIPARVEKLEQSVRGCDHVVVILTKAYVNSLWLRKELNAFYALEVSRMPNLILPVLIEECDIPASLDDRIKDGLFADFQNVSFEDGFKRLDSLITRIKRVFVIMKFDDKGLNDVYRNAIEPVIEGYGYTVSRADIVARPGELTAQIYEQIDRSEIALADLSVESPNCYFEAGYAYALKKHIIFTAREGTMIPFNIATYHILFWKDEKDLRELLREHFEKHILPGTGGKRVAS